MNLSLLWRKGHALSDVAEHVRFHLALGALLLTPGCFLEGSSTFQVAVSNSAASAVDLTVAVVRSGEPVVNRTVHLDAASFSGQPLVNLGNFSKPGDYTFRAWAGNASLSENVSFARHDSNLEIMIWVDKDFSLHLSKAVV